MGQGEDMFGIDTGVILDLLDWIYSQEIYYLLCFPLWESHPFFHSEGYPWSFSPRWELTGCYIWKHEVWQSLWRAKTQRHSSADFSWAQVHPQRWHGAPGHQTESVRSLLPLQPYLVLSSLLSESVPIYQCQRCCLLAEFVSPKQIQLDSFPWAHGTEREKTFLR